MTFRFEATAVRAEKSSRRSARFRRLTSLLVESLFFARLNHSVQAGVLPATGYNLTLAWNPSASPQVTSYHVYYGPATGNYTSNSRVGDVTTATLSGLSSGVTYYFALTAADADGVASGFSNEISYQQPYPGAQMQISGVSGGPVTLTVTGLAGQTYDLEATQDFTTWTVIGTGTTGVSGSLDFTDPKEANFPQHFYRTRQIR